jgi:hypothetical protein
LEGERTVFVMCCRVCLVQALHVPCCYGCLLNHCCYVRWGGRPVSGCGAHHKTLFCKVREQLCMKCYDCVLLTALQVAASACYSVCGALRKTWTILFDWRCTLLFWGVHAVLGCFRVQAIVSL